MGPAAALAERLGLAVRDIGLVEQALVHSSFLHEHPDEASAHNERLEYLGDAVVNLVVSEALFRRHPGDDEGSLSARRAAIVSTTGLARLATRIGLGEALLLGTGEARRGARLRATLLAASFEALAGAIYLDIGYDAVRSWLTELAEPELENDAPILSLKSPKSRLQEHTQRASGLRPHYELLEVTGPDHERRFRIQVTVGDRVLGVGEGSSRRVAETEAAARALDALRGEPA